LGIEIVPTHHYIKSKYLPKIFQVVVEDAYPSNFFPKIEVVRI